jgi:hypothetical protein
MSVPPANDASRTRSSPLPKAKLLFGVFAPTSQSVAIDVPSISSASLPPGLRVNACQVGESGRKRPLRIPSTARRNAVGAFDTSVDVCPFSPPNSKASIASKAARK